MWIGLRAAGILSVHPPHGRTICPLPKQTTRDNGQDDENGIEEAQWGCDILTLQAFYISHAGNAHHVIADGLVTLSCRSAPNTANPTP